MKPIGAIQHKLKQVRFRHMKKRIESDLSPKPANCVFNVEMSPGDKDSIETVGICTYGREGAEWNAVVCDARAGGIEQARNCSLFCPSKTKDQVKLDFQTEVGAMSLAEVAYHFPDMAALLWVMDSGPELLNSMPVDDTEPADVVPADDTSVVHSLPEPMPYVDFPFEQKKPTSLWARLFG